MTVSAHAKILSHPSDGLLGRFEIETSMVIDRAPPALLDISSYEKLL